MLSLIAPHPITKKTEFSDQHQIDPILGQAAIIRQGQEAWVRQPAGLQAHDNPELRMQPLRPGARIIFSMSYMIPGTLNIGRTTWKKDIWMVGDAKREEN